MNYRPAFDRPLPAAFRPSPHTVERSVNPEAIAPRTAPPVRQSPSPPTQASAPASSLRRPNENYLPTPFAGLGRALFTLLVLFTLLNGWLSREDGYLSAEEGIGYWLGILGGGFMLLLLVYPLRKRLRLLRNFGSVAFWFRLHMITGIIGPVLILFHANFKLGSLNSSIALLSMLTVAASGLIGRYIYAKLHKGLYGQRSRLREILADASLFKLTFGADMQDMPVIAQRMKRFEAQVLKPMHSLPKSMWAAMLMRSQTTRFHSQLKRKARKNIMAQARQRGWSRKKRRERIRNSHLVLGAYFQALNKAASYQIYERLFSLWHILHLPLFGFLILSVCVHILAVHLY